MSTSAGRHPTTIWLLFVAGPVIWFLHFMAVYLLAEAGCAAGGFAFDVFGLPVLSLVTVVATVVAGTATLLVTGLAYRRWRRRDRRDEAPPDWVAGGEGDGGLALAGFLLGLLFLVAILFVGLPAVWLEPC